MCPLELKNIYHNTERKVMNFKEPNTMQKPLFKNEL